MRFPPVADGEECCCVGNMARNGWGASGWGRWGLLGYATGVGQDLQL